MNANQTKLNVMCDDSNRRIKWLIENSKSLAKALVVLDVSTMQETCDLWEEIRFAYDAQRYFTDFDCP